MNSASRTILAYCVQHEQCLMQCIDKIKPEYFEAQEAQIYKVIAGHHRKYSKLITSNLLDKQLDSENLDVEEQQELVEIFEEAQGINTPPEEFQYHLDEVKREYTQRIWEQTWKGSVGEDGDRKEGLCDLVASDPKKAYDVFKSTIGVHMEELQNEGAARCATLGETADQFLIDYEEGEKNPQKAYGIKTGFDFLDQQTLGIHSGELFLIGGRPASGKSIFLLNVAVNAYRNGKNVLIVSIEMPLEQYRQRFYACYCDLPFYGIKTFTLTKEQKQLLKETALKIKDDEKINRHYLHIADITNVTTYTIEAEIKKVTARCGAPPDLLVIDYLGIMKSIDKSQADWQEQGAIAEEVRALGRIKGIPIIGAIQLNRDKNRNKGTERIGRSDIIGQTCDVFLQIEEKGDNEEEDQKRPLSLDLDDTINIYVGKCRNGETDRSFQLYKKFANMIVKNKGVYKSRMDQALESVNEINVPETLKVNSENTEDRVSQKSGDFISSDFK